MRTNGYASKREAEYAELLDMQKRTGVIADWFKQVRIPLTDKISYIADFQVCNLDGTVRYVEIKGFETEAWKLKYRLLEELRPWVFARLEVRK